ncbi:MAG: PD-(D/E)XK nuclease family protein, partial [Deltaproteobacteria bacterium]|nr:PD-(D/E)XK nuclease family protein [Deltaproteobacteria bacterium]
EYDLAMLDELLRERPVRGAARYLTTVNEFLGRSLRAQWHRSSAKWSPADGLVDPSNEARVALQRHALTARSYSATALQNYAACPYRFFLQAIHKLQPREEPQRIDTLDPISRGSLLHEVQFLLLRELQAARMLPLTAAKLDDARSRMQRLLGEVAAKFKDELAPAIERVWDDGVASVRADLGELLRRMTEEPRWVPWRFELAFGLPLDDEGDRDEHSSKEPVQLAHLKLRGSIDLVERDAATGALRATDYKSGKAWAPEGTVIGGGQVLQPALYALALEKQFPEVKTESGRLYYCTHRGGYAERVIALDQEVRGSIEVLTQTIGGSLTEGFFPAAPLRKREQSECARCDYLPVCGPGADKRASSKERRTGPQKPSRLVQLGRLRELP